jgi:hypothetical protein
MSHLARHVGRSVLVVLAVLAVGVALGAIVWVDPGRRLKCVMSGSTSTARWYWNCDLAFGHGRLQLLLVRTTERDPAFIRNVQSMRPVAFYSRPIAHGSALGPSSGSALARVGFAAAIKPCDGSRWVLDLAMPSWFVALVLGIGPALGVWRRRAARGRVLEGRCRVCDYDLRASGERCPECGAKIPGRLNLGRTKTGRQKTRADKNVRPTKSATGREKLASAGR